MELQTITVLDINFDVYYSVEVQRDPYGTGDSPTNYDIDIDEVSLQGDVTNLIECLSSYVIDTIYDELLEIESNK